MDLKTLSVDYSTGVLSQARRLAFIQGAILDQELFEEFVEADWHSRFLEDLRAALSEGTPDAVRLRKLLEGPVGKSDVSRTHRIDQLYGEIHELSTQNSEGVMKQKLEELRRLQLEEADTMEQRFDTRSEFALGEGRAALERAERLLKSTRNA